MVLILQQTMDNGKRFVSTVVEEESFTSNFSVTTSSSHNSISERSAIYKQRIDSLFGRHTRLNPFKPTLEPFCIRIDGGGNAESTPQSRNRNLESVSGETIATVTTTSTTTPSSSAALIHHHHRPTKSSFSSPVAVSSQSLLCNNSSSNARPAPDIDLSSEDENDDYEKIGEKNCSFVTDSLTHSDSQKNRSASSTTTGANKCLRSSSASHVSSVRLNCEEETDHSHRSSSSSHPLGPTPSSSMESEAGAQVKTVGESHMWRNGAYGESPCSSSEERQYGIVRTTPGGILKFAVEYLGSIPVDGTTTALQDLQTPLRGLYMNYLSDSNVLSGQLSITSDGLRFEAPKLRLVNPFATIAVWAAIKFVAHGDPTPTECAFMPLISDPEGQDKSRLFGRMNPELIKAYKACTSGQRAFRNPPIFACVMREASFTLDCHAFACKCAEDAIVIAANLYQSLVDKMRTTNKEGESGYGSLTRNSPANQSQGSPNENRSCSSASSQGSPRLTCSGNTSSSSGLGCEGASSIGHCEQDTCQETHQGLSASSKHREHHHRVVFSDSESVLAPVRPPRRKKKSSDGIPSSLKRYNSDDSILLKLPNRRKSIKGGGSNYNHPQYTKAKKRVQISTPDEETTSSESINESIDQVLDRIINPGGMSFNDLKPGYQELILKIALTLTQDQLYQKSKQAMKKHQQFNNGRKKSNKAQDGNDPDDNSQFLNMLLKSFSKITSGKVASNPGKRKGVSKKLPVTNNSKAKPKYPPKVILKKPSKDEDPFTSFCSGCICENCSEKCYCSLPSKHNVKVIGLPPPPQTANNTSDDGTAAVASSSPTAAAHHDHRNHNHHLDQGNVPKHLETFRKKPCGYDTDSCAESEKCYCSLQRVKSNGLKIYNINLDTETSDTDTNSYDFEPFNTTSNNANGSSNHNSHNNNGSPPHETTTISSNTKSVSSRSVEILSYHPAKRLMYNLSPPSNLHTTSALVHFEDTNSHEGGGGSSAAHCPNGNSKAYSTRNYSAGSASYLHSQSHDDLLAELAGHQRNKVLLITGSNPSTRVMYKDQYHEGRSKSHHRSHLMDITEDEYTTEDSCHRPSRRKDSKSSDDSNGMAPDKILSMKKTAEIAAMFTDLHLDQTTNLVVPSSKRERETYREPVHSNEDSSNASLDFEASLGYLP